MTRRFQIENAAAVPGLLNREADRLELAMQPRPRRSATNRRLRKTDAPFPMDETLVALDALAAGDRAFLRARVLARYDVGGRSDVAPIKRPLITVS